ncbi:MAG: cysteine desulfurase [Chloroflexi bacterium]|nr:cysteine desulfurase [Chloroflexota bacterium]
MNPRLIYLDHAATTPVHPDVLATMLPYFSEEFGNPGGLYRLSQRAKDAVESARRVIAQNLGCAPAEIIFTSGGSESDNLALRGAAFAHTALQRGQGHLIISSVEHHAVENTAKQLRDQFGFELTEVGVDRFGRVDPDDVRRAIRANTALISIMYANNEVGTIQPIAEIGRIARERGIPFHSDAVQAAAYLPVNVDALNVDLLSLGAHKFYGPKGVGLLYVRKGTRLIPTQTGGGHESNRRAGTENVPYIAGMAKALDLTQTHRERNIAVMNPLRERLINTIPTTIARASLTGHPSERLPHNASFVIEGVEAGPVLLALDLAGIAASSGSACTSAAMEPSHVLKAMGVPRLQAHGALRLTLGPENAMDEIDVVLETLPDVVSRLRKLSEAP